MAIPGAANPGPAILEFPGFPGFPGAGLPGFPVLPGVGGMMRLMGFWMRLAGLISCSWTLRSGCTRPGASLPEGVACCAFCTQVGR